MEFTELIRSRYSVRAYRPDPVEDEKLQAVLEAVRLAPAVTASGPIVDRRQPPPTDSPFRW
jgi:nitroreductase